MRSEPVWLSVEQLIRINQIAVAETDDPFQLLSPGLLESAWGKPINRWHYGEDDPVMLAVVLLFAIARNHPFQQDNKRTGFIAAVAFLAKNGYALIAPDSEAFAEAIIAVVGGKVPEDRLFAVFRDAVVPLD